MTSQNLKAALAAGITPDPAQTPLLVERAAVEPDFFVRDMITWALTRAPAGEVVPLLLEQLSDPRPQARSQSLHTLSKIRDAAAWPAITPGLLHDRDPEVARSAWRAAVALVPPGEEAALAAELAGALGRGDAEQQRSLSRALAALGPAAVQVLRARSAHAAATLKLIEDPDSDFIADLAEARRVAALGPTPQD